MTTSNQPEAVSALHEILEWSAGRPLWQRDALRRIVVAGKLDASDVVELSALCRLAHEPQDSSSPTPAAQPLNASHLPAGTGAEQQVTLVSLSALRGVNRLPSSQVLPFGSAQGMTVIYGDNGVGKSGYARVLKRACRSRGALPHIKPDAFSGKVTSEASATIAFRAGGKDETVTWANGSVSDPRLSNVFIFDTSSAGNYVEQDGPASFTPYGLDVLLKLSKACDTIGLAIQQEIDQLNQETITASKGWKAGTATVVGKMITTLNSNTTSEMVTELAGISELQAKRLKELGDLLRADPKQKAKQTRASAERLNAFAALLNSAARDLSAEEIMLVSTCQSEAHAAAIAAKAFASDSIDPSLLKGTGETFWRKLWEASRAFSQSLAYADKEFPVTDVSASCVLCQQTLDSAATSRLNQLNALYADKSQLLSDDAAKKLKGVKERIDRIAPLETERKKIEVDLNDSAPEVILAVSLFVNKSDAALSALKESLSTGVWTDADALPPSPEQAVRVLASGLLLRAKEEDGADDPAARKKLEEERDLLADREWLGKAKSEVLAQIARHKRVVALTRCQKDTATRAVTTMNSDLTKRIVTDAFRNRFKEELNELGLRTIGVRLQDMPGAKGEVRFGLRLDPDSAMAVRDVASEGEHRCIALAAFLAELSQATHQSALVFDDPVSSLDHWHRDRIASRLVKESKTRQVIVFTHDAVFLNDIHAQVEESGASGNYFHLAWNGNEPGHCYDGLPWECKSPEDRLDKLEKKCGEIASSWGPKPSEGNIAEIRNAYSWLRQTIERLVEKTVFADVVFRYRSYVKLKDLRRTVGFTYDECDEIERLFRRCCGITEAHDAPQGKQGAIPEPADLKKDIDAVKTVLSKIRERQKNAAKVVTPVTL